MSYRWRPPHSRWWRAGVVSVALALGLAACGGSGNKPQAKEPDPAKADQAKTPWTGPTESVAPPKSAKVTILSCGSSDFSCAVTAQATKTAAEALGWQATAVDGKLDPKSWNAVAKNAASQGQDALILAGASPALMSDGIAEAQKAGIAVVGISFPPADGVPDLDGHITVDYAASGVAMAHYFMEESGGTKKMMTLDAVEWPEIVTRNSSLRAAVKKECDTCDVRRTFFDSARIETILAGQTTSILEVSSPKSDYILAPNEATEAHVLEGIKRYEDRNPQKLQPQLVGFGSSPDAAARIKDGSQVAAQVSPLTYMGWFAVDQTARLLADQSPKKVHVVPELLVVKDNVDVLDGDQGWQLDNDFDTKFRDLWGVAS